MGIDDLDNRFTYHPQKPGQPEMYQRIRDEARLLAETINALCPDSREKSLAITNLEQATMWANASIARAPEDTERPPEGCNF